jgi:predicted nucleic acid-binding Zn ribbon protein
VLYPVAVHFKGSGFYSTDYGRGNSRKGAKEGESGSGDSSGSDKDKPSEPKKAAEAS